VAFCKTALFLGRIPIQKIVVDQEQWPEEWGYGLNRAQDGRFRRSIMPIGIISVAGRG
jgi:hypothetical protein